jgi:CubicO group peptidase (beta-lactamase class C family)
MHRYLRLRRPAAIFCLLTSLLTAAQQKPNGTDQEAAVRKVVDGIMQPFLNQHHIPGAIVGVSLQGKDYFFPYGKATDTGDPFTADTLVEIGSCTKVYTTTLFALAANRGQIGPDGPAEKYMPDGFTLRPSARQVTPLELADFTSGMPDDPTDLPPGPLWKRNIEHYTTDNFLKWVSHWEPATKLPAPYLYSNAGIGLLSYLVATATGKSWEDQLNAEIVQPLNLQDTTLHPTLDQKKRMAQGHHANGSNAPPWPVFAWYAAGGLRSTARDMLRFGEANLGHKEVDGRPVSDKLVAAMQLAQKPIYTLPNGRNKQAMAWVHNIAGPGTHPVILKNGGTVGFGSVIVLNPAKDLTLFIAVNQNGSNPAGIGVEMARHLP